MFDDMQVIRTVAEMREARRGLTGSVGLVATLGGIHVGHTTHMDTLRPLVDVMIGSIFLNPTQFGENEDLSSYPANEAEDLTKFAAHGADIVFVPSVDEMYPVDGETVPDIDPGPVAHVLEGAHRPGHFDGVATVVNRLFSIISPDKATFGEKDAQQLRIIQHLIDSQNLGVEIVTIPIVRDEDGLAISSRNAYLSREEREAALVLNRALRVAKISFSEGGERNGEILRGMMAYTVNAEPLAELGYVSIVDADSFEELDVINVPARALVAAQVGKARLIDNMMLG